MLYQLELDPAGNLPYKLHAVFGEHVDEYRFTESQNLNHQTYKFPTASYSTVYELSPTAAWQFWV